MNKTLPVFLILLLIGLVACTTYQKLPDPLLAMSPSAGNATQPSAIDHFTSTPLPSPTFTDTPAPTATPTIDPFIDDSLKGQVDRLAMDYLKWGHGSGLSVAVVRRNPQTGQLEAMLLNYGYMSKHKQQPVASDTVYEIGSLTKVFTGILLAQAVDNGKMNLDDPVQNYLPDGVHLAAYKNQPIRLVDLATHRSGLPRDIGVDDPAGLYQWLNGYQPSIAPGAEYIYSNLGYMVLGDILTRLSQSDFNTLEYADVSEPLGLSDTREVLTDEEKDRLAQGYYYDGSPTSYFPDSGTMSAAGYLRSTLNDMTRFLLDNMQASATPLGSSLQLAQTVQSPGRNPGEGTALGWEIDDLDKPSEVIWKSGGTDGFTSHIEFMKDGSAGFVLLSNGQYVDDLAVELSPLLEKAGN